jgi:hypothetical protein
MVQVFISIRVFTILIPITIVTLDLIFLKIKLFDGDYLSLEYRFVDYFNQLIGNNLNPLCCLRIHMRIEF